jgi:uncharacterized protein
VPETAAILLYPADVRVLIAGGSGFLGRALRARWQRRGHRVRILTREPRAGSADEVAWAPGGGAGPWARVLDDTDVVVNLAGEGIADKRWTTARKQALRDSRLRATHSLVAGIVQAATPPQVLISGSGVDYYSGPDSAAATESTPPGTTFLARLCVDWEAAAEQASSVTRVALVRTAPVLHPDGGALRQMLLPFRLGVGGRLGSGAQYFPWIHLDDWLDLVDWLIEEQRARGAFNAAAATPATNAEFTRALGRALSRPAIIPVPAFALRLALGELADTLLTGRPILPARAREMGFTFRHGEIGDALSDLLR